MHNRTLSPFPLIHSTSSGLHLKAPGPGAADAKLAKGYRFPPEIIQQAIWLYLRFTLSFRDVEDLMAERGIMISYEIVRRWVNHFGPMIAADLRNRRPKPYTTFYLKIDGRMVYLWRAVDAESEVLDVLIQSRRNKRAALEDRLMLAAMHFAPIGDLANVEPVFEVMGERPHAKANTAALAAITAAIDFRPDTSPIEGEVPVAWAAAKLQIASVTSIQSPSWGHSTNSSRDPRGYRTCGGCGCA
jgi:hypothetical protein